MCKRQTTGHSIRYVHQKSRPNTFTKCRKISITAGYINWEEGYSFYVQLNSFSGCDFKGGCLEAGKKYFDKENCVLYRCVVKDTTEGSISTKLKERWGKLLIY
jgi:hypothetical protein